MILASAFLKQLQTSQLDIKPIYLLYGEEPLFLRDCLDGLRNRLTEQGYLAGDVYDVDANADWQSLQMDTQAGSLFAETRMILVNLPKGSSGKDGTKFFQDWCALNHANGSLPPEVVLVVLCERLDSRQVKAKWVSAIESAGLVVQAKPVPSNALPQWCLNQAQVYGLSLENEAASLLAERVEGNLLAADQELVKLSLILPPGSTISAEQVKQHVVDQAHYQLFALATEMLMGNRQHSLQMLTRLQQEGIEAPVILWLIAKELRQLIELAKLTEQVNLNQAFKQCRIWSSRQAEYTQALKRQPQHSWQALLKQALEIDLMIKGIQPILNDREIWSAMSALIAKIAQ